MTHPDVATDSATKDLTSMRPGGCEPMASRARQAINAAGVILAIGMVGSVIDSVVGPEVGPEPVSAALFAIPCPDESPAGCGIVKTDAETQR